MKKHIATALIIGATLLRCQADNEIGYAETFALANDRAAALRELIPGTEDYYFYHCLHYEQTAQWKALDQTLDQWISRYRQSPRIDEIRNRRALLRYEADPQASLKYIQERLGILFNHQKIPLEPAIELPSHLDPALIEPNQLLQAALQREPNSTVMVETRGLERLLTSKLSPNQRRHLLQRLERPDYPALVNLIIADLRHPHSGGFGSLPIHTRLLPEQLEACLQHMPDLIANTSFVNTSLTRLHPNPDRDWTADPAATDAYLTAMKAFTDRLPPAFNSLKAHVLYHRLFFNRRQGRYDADLFMEYLKLPRQTAYMHPEYLRQREFQGYLASLDAGYAEQTLLPPVGDDEPLVRDYLLTLLKDAPDTQAYARYILADYLQALFAETKMVNGIGDMEQWYSLLTPSQVRALRERIDIELLPVNPERFAVDAPVTLDVAVKNIPRLLVRTFELNAENFYRTQAREIEATLDLDGLVAGVETNLTFDLPPIRRHHQRIALPHIQKPGVYVVELIGNGVSSRALIRKGRLRFTERIGSAGHVFTLYDDAGQRLTNAAIWIAGHDYRPDADGDIRVPFSTRPTNQSMVLSHAGFAQLATFDHRDEAYQLMFAMHAERETFIPGAEGRLIIRPELTLHGRRIDIGLLEEPRLELTTRDLFGITSSQELKDIALTNNAPFIHAFKTPKDLQHLSVTLRGRVRNVTHDRDDDLTFTAQVELNQIHATDRTEQIALRKLPEGYRVELLGKTGEPLPDRAIQFTLKHGDFVQPIHTALKTDTAGRIALGPLPGIVSLIAQGPQNVAHRWTLIDDAASQHPVLHALAGEPVRLAFMRQPPATPEEAFSLLETRGDDIYVRDRRPHAAISDDELVITDLPPGDYDLWLKAEDRHITLRVTAGQRDRHQNIGQDRLLEQPFDAPLQITTARSAGNAVHFRIQNATPDTRLQLLATRFVPHTSLFHNLGAPALPPPAHRLWPTPDSLYISGRNIGDEYRYILERKQTAAFPGNMLKRPSLLLNPWSLRQTETGRAEAAEGEGWLVQSPVVLKSMLGGRDRGERGGLAGSGTMDAGPAFNTSDFLPSPSVLLTNLEPDPDGNLSIPLAKLGGGRYLQIYAANATTAAYRQFALPETEEAFEDLPLPTALDPQQRFSEQRKVDIAPAGTAFVIEDLRTAEIELYDTLPKAYHLLLALTDNANLRAFAFILDWPRLTPEARLEQYAKYACHELNVFLYHKDPAFFRDVIRPYLAHKQDQTFIDDWLLEADLSRYRDLFTYLRLNAAERVLLARRDPATAPSTQRHLADRHDLIPFDVERFTQRFETALKADALSGGDQLGIGAVRNALAAAESENRGKVKTVIADFSEVPARPGGARRQLARADMAFADAPSAAPPSEELEEPQPAPIEMSPASAGKAAEAMDDLTYAEMGGDAREREQTRRFYRKLDPTEEWAENNYYQLPIAEQNAALIPVNGFWRDAAAYDGKGPFLSPRFIEATSSFAEMMFTLALLDLPFEAGEHQSAFDKARMTLTPASAAVAFHKQIRPVIADAENGAILVTQNVFAHDDRYRYEGSEAFEKFVTEEFIVGRVYGCRIVMTNPSASRRKVDMLLQIPEGALPVMRGFFTRSFHHRLEPYTTITQEFLFYFPRPGTFAQYPVTVTEEAALMGAATPITFTVRAKPTRHDETSWEYVSQHGTAKEVLGYLDRENIERLNLELIAFRMRDAGFFRDALRLLEQRHVFQATLWSYGIHHNVPDVIRTYLPHTPLAQACGAHIRSRLLDLDPVRDLGELQRYQHKEYWPLVNARVYQLGKTRRILNQAFHTQYHAYLNVMQYKPALDAHDQLVAVVYLFLQDRIGEALEHLERIDATGLHARMPLDYLRAYAAFCRAQPAEALSIAQAYTNHPVARWRNLFGDVAAQVAEIAGAPTVLTDADDRDQQQARLADTAPVVELEIAGPEIRITSRNVPEAVLRFYPMDLELLFSRRPFVQDVGDQFALIRPNREVTLTLAADQPLQTLPIPEDLKDRNVMIEVAGAGITRRAPYYPNALAVQVMENYGQVRVAAAEGHTPLPGVYVKVYARMGNGQVSFYKDGYTDLRGRFDYTSLNTGEIDAVERFALLIMSDTHGALTREAAPPKL